MIRICRNIAKAGHRVSRPGMAGTAVLALVAGSCAPMMEQVIAPGAPLTAAQLASAHPVAEPAALDTAAPVILSGEQAMAANATLPIAAAPSPAAASLAFTTPSAIAQMRAIDCLAQAIYYEARSQSEEGQRAVAQVVLNRVRHPAWPNSVCGVVYQGPMRPGGGCQFTFTCDGSLAHRAYGEDWARARRLAAEALAGRVFEPVGLSTFYHANYVMPAWAPRLLKTAVIGAHLFYRLPGASGTPAAFSDRYAGVEPIARPGPILFPRRGLTVPANVSPGVGRGNLPSWMQVSTAGRSEPAPPPAAAPSLVADPEPMMEDLQIRPEYRNSGQWRTDAPAALSGR